MLSVAGKDVIWNSSLAAKLKKIEGRIGHTPLYRFSSLEIKGRSRIYGKVEWQQMGGSVKARAAFGIIKQAIQNGWLDQDIRLLDASSGNTGIAYAAIAAALGMTTTLCLPANASPERKAILKSLGVEVILTDPMEGTDGAQIEAQAIFNNNPYRYYYADQYNNPANWQAHYIGTSEEIFRQTKGMITHLVTGLGTTGSFTGLSRGLKERNAEIKCVALQPDGPMHGMEGWKDLSTARVPGIYDDQLVDSMMTISTEEAYEMMRFIAKHEGLLLSPSAAANLVGARKLGASVTKGSVVVTLLPDNADKYHEVLKSIIS
jgi:S-sulfo-L-cysteine synthase (O-acetyl-L-serine-dependent)